MYVNARACTSGRMGSSLFSGFLSPPLPPTLHITSHSVHASLYAARNPEPQAQKNLFEMAKKRIN
jgi:hypothetical protein